MPRGELARSIPDELLEHVCALGAHDALVARISAYFDAGADVVGVVPSTAEDPARSRRPERGRRLVFLVTLVVR